MAGTHTKHILVFRVAKQGLPNSIDFPVVGHLPSANIAPDAHEDLSMQAPIANSKGAKMAGTVALLDCLHLKGFRVFQGTFQAYFKEDSMSKAC